jgi:hypothetical protein
MLRFSKLYLACSFLFLLAPAVNAFAAGFPIVPEQNNRAFYVDTTICSVVIKTSINPTASIQQGTPVDSLIGQPAICTSSVSGQSQISTGVRQLIGNGFRITGVSHAVTVLGQSTTDRSDLLISAIFTLERPQVAPINVPNNQLNTR